MPLKLTPGMKEEGKIASLNRWADYIETQLRQTNNAVAFVNNKAVSTTINNGSSVAPIYQDHFHGPLAGTAGGGVSGLSVGQLGWNIVGNITTAGGYFGGAIDHPGQFAWSNTAVASQAGWLMFNVNGGNSNGLFNQNGMALGEENGWTATFVFKLDSVLGSSPLFDTTKKSIYIGLVGPTIAGTFTGVPTSRPDVFVGVRFDTSTTSPSINDSKYTLEVVGNTSFTTFARNNTQGTTKTTATAPTIGQWQTLTITCTTTGNVTLTFNDGTTLSTSVPTVTLSSISGAGFAQNGVARVNWTPSGSVPISPWGASSSVTISGFTAGRVGLNGTFPIIGADNGDVWFHLGSTITNGSDTITLAGFPSLQPCFMLGNDDTAAPTANGLMLFVDEFTLFT